MSSVSPGPDPRCRGRRRQVAHPVGAARIPTADRLVFGDKGRPELATGVLERVMREMNRRTDVGVRWSIPGARGMLMFKLARKYHHRQWSPKTATSDSPNVRFALVA